jgi:hypothetical protein
MATWTRDRLGAGLALALSVGVLALGSLVAFGPPAGADVFRTLIGQPASSLTKSCGKVKRNGVKWHVVARGVSCTFSKSWLSRMIAARERERSLWNAPPAGSAPRSTDSPTAAGTARPPARSSAANAPRPGGFQMGWHRV